MRNLCRPCVVPALSQWAPGRAYRGQSPRPRAGTLLRAAECETCMRVEGRCVLFVRQPWTGPDVCGARHLFLTTPPLEIDKEATTWSFRAAAAVRAGLGAHERTADPEVAGRRSPPRRGRRLFPTLPAPGLGLDGNRIIHVFGGSPERLLAQQAVALAPHRRGPRAAFARGAHACSAVWWCLPMNAGLRRNKRNA